MIKVYHNPKKRYVIAHIPDTTWDVVNKLNKLEAQAGVPLGTVDNMMRYSTMLMPNEFKVKVVCDPKDEFDAAKGEEIARERVLKKYYAAYDKRMNKAKTMIRALYHALGCDED